MATPKSQRIGIWIITIVMAIGAVGVYFVSILANNNDTEAQRKQQEAFATYQSQVKAQAKTLSDKHYPTFSQFASRVGGFDKAAAQEKLVSEDLLAGDGEVITDKTKFSAYYIGWMPDGTIFDQSIENQTLKTPYAVTDGLANAQIVAGWKQGLVGIKIGGVRELTIPSEEAYGSGGYSTTIPADTPLKFIVMAIPYVEEIPLPPELRLSQ